VSIVGEWSDIQDPWRKVHTPGKRSQAKALTSPGSLPIVGAGLRRSAPDVAPKKSPLHGQISDQSQRTTTLPSV
jgi:hypothetical protein